MPQRSEIQQRQVAQQRQAVGASRYHIIGSLGNGGMAGVELALQTSVANVRRLAVVKRVRADLVDCPEFTDMFLEEARISASLSHPNIVQTYDVGHDANGSFLAMEFLRGQSYEALLSRVGLATVDYQHCLEVLLATLQGLEYAHDLKDVAGRPMALVHRDISPPNLFITYDGQIKILDFGIAKVLDSSVHTKVGTVKGKVSYMAPEQLRNAPTDARADLYAVGVMLWEATAGRRRWLGKPDIAIMNELATRSTVEPPRAAEHGLPSLADEICLRALAYDPRNRYASATEFRADLLCLMELVGRRRSPREIGQYVARLFSIDRQRQQQFIDSALQQFVVGPTEVHTREQPKLKTRVLIRDPKRRAIVPQTAQPFERLQTAQSFERSQTAQSFERRAVPVAPTLVETGRQKKLGFSLRSLGFLALGIALPPAALAATSALESKGAVSQQAEIVRTEMLARASGDQTEPLSREHQIEAVPIRPAGDKQAAAWNGDASEMESATTETAATERAMAAPPTVEAATAETAITPAAPVRVAPRAKQRRTVVRARRATGSLGGGPKSSSDGPPKLQLDRGDPWVD